jgi:acetyltransferase-like isoleucine patch superfamily enzyme
MTETQIRSSGGAGLWSLKRLLNLAALGLTSPAALTCWLARRRGKSEAVFVFWTNVVAMLPGTPGLFLRRAFYRWTLERCAEAVTIEFGALFSRRNARLDAGVYVGAYALIGSAWLQANCLVGSRVSLLSGGKHHELLPSGQWSATDHTKLDRIVIGANTWIGEGAILMAGTGSGCMVAAGAVVSAPVPAGVMVAGNPARFVRRLAERPEDIADEVPVSAVR